MTEDIVISGRIPLKLLNELNNLKLDKSKTEIINEALVLYISKIKQQETRIQRRIHTFSVNDYQNIDSLVDSLISRYNHLFNDAEED